MSQLDIRTHLALGTAWVLLAIGELVQPACAEDDLDERIYEFAYDYDLPAVGYAVLVDGTLAASGAVGERRFDSGIEIGPDESFRMTVALRSTSYGKCGPGFRGTCLLGRPTEVSTNCRGP